MVFGRPIHMAIMGGGPHIRDCRKVEFKTLERRVWCPVTPDAQVAVADM